MRYIVAFLIGLLLGAIFIGHASAAPLNNLYRSIIPEVDNTYNIGTTSPSNLRYNGFFNNVTVSGTCTGCGSGGSSFAYPFTDNGNISTSTGLMLLASTTIGAGSQTTGLTISGGATTTGNLYASGNTHHFGAASCSSGGLLFSNLKGLEYCGVDNTDTGGIQIIEANNSNGTSAWGGFTLNNDLADSTLTHFGGLFYNSSTYTSSFFGTAFANKNQLTLQATDGLLTIMSSTSTDALNPAGINFVTAGTASTNERMRIDIAGRVGIGTTTPRWLLDLATSTAPQLTIDGGAGNPSWAFRNAGGNLYLATTSQTTFATTSLAALQLNPTGVPLLLIGTSTVTTNVIEDVFSTASTSLRLDSNSATKGGCLVLKDSDGSGYTYVTGANGVLTASQTTCL